MVGDVTLRGSVPKPCYHGFRAGRQNQKCWDAEQVHPEVVAVMTEIGIDMAKAKPRRLTEEVANRAHVLVTMGCGEACPFVPGLHVIDWSLPDPKGQPMDAVRQIRDLIHEHVKNLLRNDCAGCCSDLIKESTITNK